MLPILPEKAGKVRDFWDDAHEKFSAEIEGHFKLFGVREVQVFLQSMPDDRYYMTMYLRSGDDTSKTLNHIFGSSVGCSKFFTDHFRDFTGLDMSKAENWLKPQVLMDWRETHEYLEERNMVEMPWCYAAPLKPGMTDRVLRLVDEYSKPGTADWTKMLRDHDVVRNMSCLQRTQQGDFIVKYIVASNTLEELMKAFLDCNDELCNRSRQMALELTGIDYSDPKNLPGLRLLFKWDDRQGFVTAEQQIAYTE